VQSIIFVGVPASETPYERLRLSARTDHGRCRDPVRAALAANAGPSAAAPDDERRGLPCWAALLSASFVPRPAPKEDMPLTT
jgi:hypothetical protein